VNADINIKSFLYYKKAPEKSNLPFS